MKYKAGDKVWVVCDRPDVSLMGLKPAVVDGPSDDHNRRYPASGPWYLVTIDGWSSEDPTGCWAGREKNIFPRDEDGRQVGVWEHSTMIWDPTREKVT